MADSKRDFILIIHTNILNKWSSRNIFLNSICFNIINGEHNNYKPVIPIVYTYGLGMRE